MEGKQKNKQKQKTWIDKLISLVEYLLVGGIVVAGICWFVWFIVSQFPCERDRQLVMYIMTVSSCLVASATLGFTILGQKQLTPTLNDLTKTIEELQETLSKLEGKNSQEKSPIVPESITIRVVNETAQKELATPSDATANRGTTRPTSSNKANRHSKGRAKQK